jgi:hypothetical protein
MSTNQWRKGRRGTNKGALIGVPDPEAPLVPTDAILDEDNQPILDESDGYITE